MTPAIEGGGDAHGASVATGTGSNKEKGAGDTSNENDAPEAKVDVKTARRSTQDDTRLMGCYGHFPQTTRDDDGYDNSDGKLV